MMTRIDNYLKRFEAYKNGDLNFSERSAFKEDLEKDFEMQKAWKEYTSILRAISDKEAISLRALLEKTYNKQFKAKQSLFTNIKWLRASAAAIAIIATGTLLYFFCTRNNDSINLKNQTLLVNNDTRDIKTIEDTLSQEDNDQGAEKIIQDTIIKDFQTQNVDKYDKIASIYSREEYQINPIYKELLNSVYRGNWFNVLSPEDSVITESGESQVFKWETNISDSIYFDVLDRNGRIIYTHKSSIKSPWTFEKTLDPAIYIYRFSTTEEPLWVGVMVIGN